MSAFFLVAFGVYYQADGEERAALLHRFLHFLSCMVFDRLCLRQDLFAMRRLHFMTRLKRGPMPTVELNEWSENLQDDDQFIDDFGSFAVRCSTASGSMFRLTHDAGWHCLLPWESFESIAALMTAIFTKNPNVLVPFPDFDPDQ
jgi:hypothetical protein